MNAPGEEAPLDATESAASISVAIAIAPLTRSASDLEAVDEIARSSAMELNFSADKELERPWARIWIAREQEASSAPVAFLIAWHVADELHILNVATATEARRRGIGTALMNVALAYAKEHRVRLVLLEVRRSNDAARRLYLRLGFSDSGVRPGYYADSGEDAIEMMLILDPQPLP